MFSVSKELQLEWERQAHKRQFCKGLPGVFSSTTVRKHQFFGAQPSLWSNSHIYLYMTTRKSIALIFTDL